MNVFGTVLPDDGPKVALPPPITAWSYSRLSTYQKCPQRAKYQFVDKLPEPEAEAIVRGKAAHSFAGKLISEGEGATFEPSELALVEVLRPWRGLLSELRDRAATSELQAAFTQKWEPTDWFSRAAWLRVVFDAVASSAEGDHLDVYEFKTGRAHPDHEQQKTLYAVSAMALAPKASTVDVHFVYFDQPGTHLKARYDRPSADRFRVVWEERARPLLTDTEFHATPGRHCSWCPFSKKKGGPCNAG